MGIKCALMTLEGALENTLASLHWHCMFHAISHTFCYHTMCTVYCQHRYLRLYSAYKVTEPN